MTLRRYPLRLEPELYSRVEAAAQATNSSVNQVLTWAVMSAFPEGVATNSAMMSVSFTSGANVSFYANTNQTEE